MRYSEVKSDVGNHAEFSQQIWPFLNFTIFEILKFRPQDFHRVPPGGHGENFFQKSPISQKLSHLPPHFE